MDRNLLRRRRFLTYTGLGVLGIGSAAIAIQLNSSKPLASSILSLSPNSELPKSNSPEASPVATNSQSSNQQLPEFQGISQWLNSHPLSIQELKGNVVMIQFWTFSCINCQRTLPYVTKWHEQYAAKGLKIIGVHTPEFAFEREANNIKDAIQKHGIRYPVPIDNEFQTWKAYGNEYWPHLYLADRQGNLVYDHIGEGAYTKTEQTIQKLLG
ncbi:thioredoxin family protein [Pseudanabaena sp. ABRG5-3]|uniref:thioredoxin family protein n=1 Tax=Pseudanabaena sp. ABRG5-3 TaxID=685565 RepID=UPI000DC6F8E0|nr:thioredoxin family protein [Pseudanabaena sp. ABRG5-3]BBC22599.1 alkyl hydroperoxide reductase/ thiol specific antioxidant/ mal allergen [Pseudanabaena sp. ABRG5-3]